MAEFWVALPPDTLGASPQGQSRLDAYDFVLEFTGTPAVHDAFAGMTWPAPIDSQRSAVFAGTEYCIVPGRGEVALFCPLIRRAHLGPAQFQHYWLHEHARFGRDNPHNGYCQVHPAALPSTDRVTASALPHAPFDGVAEAYFVDLPAMLKRLNSPEIAGDAYADEQRFIDHARSSFLPFERGGIAAR
ncbi:hypothetical protein ASE49_05670 [Novosphingobium sp. Leaf2]|nr:hypothetical protein ASE49_05670 [Novosphingobium sp. Leaf2]